MPSAIREGKGCNGEPSQFLPSFYHAFLTIEQLLASVYAKLASANSTGSGARTNQDSLRLVVTYGYR